MFLFKVSLSTQWGPLHKNSKRELTTFGAKPSHFGMPPAGQSFGSRSQRLRNAHSVKTVPLRFTKTTMKSFTPGRLPERTGQSATVPLHLTDHKINRSSSSSCCFHKTDCTQEQSTKNREIEAGSWFVQNKNSRHSRVLLRNGEAFRQR